MNFFKKISGYFSQRESKSDGEDLNNRMVISLNPKRGGEPFIKIIVGETSDDSAKQFAEMLFNVNSGLYYGSIVDLLISMSKEDDEINRFMKSAMVYWSHLIQESNDSNYDRLDKIKWSDDKPLIKPTEFNKYAK